MSAGHLLRVKVTTSARHECRGGHVVLGHPHEVVEGCARPVIRSSASDTRANHLAERWRESVAHSTPESTAHMRLFRHKRDEQGE